MHEKLYIILRDRQTDRICIFDYFVLYSQGDTLETGHYTAACKNPYDHQWYKFDDQRVNVVPNDRVQDEIVNNEAYILFYQRRKDDSAECSGSNSSSSGEHWVSKMCTTPITLSADAKKNDVEKLTKVPIEKAEPEPIVAVHSSNKIIQTEDIVCAADKQAESATTDIVAANEECASKLATIDVPIKVEPTNEDEIVDVIGLDTDAPNEVEQLIDSDIGTITTTATTTIAPTTATATTTTISPTTTTPTMMASKEADNVNSLEKIIDENIPVETTIKINDAKANCNGSNRNNSCSSKTSNKTTAANQSHEIDIDIEVELRNMTVKKGDGALSVSFPTQRSLWPFENHHNTIHTYTPILSRGSLNFNDLLANERNAHLRHSLSTTLGHSKTVEKAATVIGVTATDTLAMVRGASSCSKDTLIFVDKQTHRHRSIMNEEFLANQPLWVSTWKLFEQ